MNMPSSIQAAMPTSGAATSHGRYARASARTSGAAAIRSISAGPASRKATAIASEQPTPHSEVTTAARRKAARSRRPMVCPTSASAAKAKPSSA